jgi:hypothetical protein
MERHVKNHRHFGFNSCGSLSARLHAVLPSTGQDSSIVGHGVTVAADFIFRTLFVSIILALSFSLSFTPLLGVALLVRMKAPTQDYRKALQTFAVSLIPFAVSLWCFWNFILPEILHHR